MKHLAPEELTDLADGMLPAERARHLDHCARCRAEAEALRTMIGHAREVEVPEPSPLFWEHFPRRVSDTIATSSARTRPQWRQGRLTIAATAATAMLALVVGFSTLRSLPSPAGETEAPALATDAGPEFAVDGGEITDTGPDWLLVLTMADAAEWDTGDADALFVDRETIDGALAQLTSDERRELARLLEAELSGSVS